MQPLLVNIAHHTGSAYPSIILIVIFILIFVVIIFILISTPVIAHYLHHEHAALLNQAPAAHHFRHCHATAQAILKARQRLLGFNVLSAQQTGEGVVQLAEEAERCFGRGGERPDVLGEIAC
jgi:hypothetical protein